MSTTDWTRRWTGDEGRHLAAAVIERLRQGLTLDDLPLERHDDRVDLRGLLITSPEQVATGIVAEDREGPGNPHTTIGLVSGFAELRDSRLTNLDFSHARLDSLRFFNVTVHGCRFDDASCRDWRGWGLSVTDSTFRQADLRDSALGTWWEGRGNTFGSSDFDGADLSELTFDRAIFTDCSFDGASLDRTRFNHCTLRRCRFTGLLDEVIWTGGVLDDLDLSKAILRWSEFRDVQTGGVLLPEDRVTHVIVQHYPCVVRRALARLEQQPDPATETLLARLQADLSNLDDSRTTGLWHRDEIGDDEEEQRAARTVLEEAEHDCTADQP